MNTKNILKWIMSLCITTILLGSCKDNDSMGPLAEAVPLKLELSKKYLVFGENTDVILSVNNPEGSELLLNEDIEVTFSMRCTDADGNSIPNDEIFEGFVEKTFLKKGDRSFSFNLQAKSKAFKFPINAEISAFTRGYNIANNKQNLSVSDYHYATISLKGNSDNTVYEGEKFILQADITGAPSEDLHIKVNIPENQKSFCEGIPEELVIPAGKTSIVGGLVTVKDGTETTADRKLNIEFESNLSAHPIGNEEKMLTVNILDVDKPLEDKLTDERYINPKPQLMYVSDATEAKVTNWAPTKMYKKMSVGDPHPSSSLSSSWSFLRSMEFHHIDNCMFTNTEYGTFPPKGLSAQDTKKVQEYQGLNNEKYSTITEDGYLKMWCVKEKTQAVGGGIGIKDYGTSAFYANKFTKDAGSGMNQAASQNVLILPGMRIEFRARIRGNNKGFNAALWLQGNAYTDQVNWPEFGEIDIMENPCGRNGDPQIHATLHYAPNDQGNSITGNRQLTNITEWNVYWCEILNDNSIVIGVNGETIGTFNSTLTGNVAWPFTPEVNPRGYHIILTLAAPSKWGLGGGTTDANDYWTPDKGWDTGFANITYEQSKTHPNTPRMEIDWIRFYTNSDYQSHLTNSGFNNKEQMFY